MRLTRFSRRIVSLQSVGNLWASTASDIERPTDHDGVGLCFETEISRCALDSCMAQGECHQCDAPCPAHPQKRLKNIATAEIEDLARMRRSVKLPSVKFRDFTLMTRLLRGGSSRGRPVFRWLSLLLLRPLRPPSFALNREHLAVCLELRLQDRLREQQRPPHARARAHIHKLVLIWRKQVLTRGERGRDHPLTLGVGPHINEPLLLGVVEQRLLARELPWQHRPSVALLEPSLPRHWAVLPTYPLRPLNALQQTAKRSAGYQAKPYPFHSRARLCNVLIEASSGRKLMSGADC